MTGLPAYQHNGKTISAEAFYAIACDPRRNVAVEACAGAGKTWMLVSRIVRALLHGVDGQGQLTVQPHEILAITFTKRAASEMRERLYQWLAEFAAADGETLARELKIRGVLDEGHLQIPGDLPEKLSKLYQSVLATGRQVQIRTFHSWFAALLRGAPLAVLQQLELPSNYELLEDDARAKTLVRRRFYAALAAAPERKADFEAVVSEHGRYQCEKALAVALDKRIEFTLADAQGVVEASVLQFFDLDAAFAGFRSPDEFISANDANLQLLRDAAQALGRASAPSFAAMGVALETALTDGNLDDAFAALLTKSGTRRVFSEKIIGIATVRAAQDIVMRVVAARHQHAAWRYQQRMTRLSRVLIAEFAALKRERGWVDMNDVERAALFMLGDPVLSGWVQQRLDARIQHLLIDEFQDTNPLQWQALLSWLGSYAGAGGGGAPPSVFIVGDPKQSIYRFRRAEPQVFKAAQAFVCDGLGGDLLKCDHTRRNARQIIASVNGTMALAREEDGYEGFREHTTSSHEVGVVCKLPQIPREPVDFGANPGAIENDDDDAASAAQDDAPWRDSLTTPRELPEATLRALEARQAATWIAHQLAAGQGALQPQDIMVLSRKRASLAPVQDALRALHIAAQVGEKTELIDCCEVQDMVALLDVLVSPQHDLSLARVLKSPLFGVDDEVLVQLALLQQQAGGQLPVDSLPGSPQPPQSPQPRGTGELPSWFSMLYKLEQTIYIGRGKSAILSRWKGWVDQLPPHDALQAIYADGDVLARYAVAAPAAQREAVLANLRALLGVSLQLGGGRYATPYAMVRALKAGGVMAPAAVVQNAVRLLTVHGAKGLEAHTVLLLDTDTAPRKADAMGVLVDWPGESAVPRTFVFMASESKPPACAVDTLAAEVTERQREELNALYVAQTRARHTLALSSIEPYRTAEKSWWARLSGFSLDVAVSVSESDALGAEGVPTDASFDLLELPELPGPTEPVVPPAVVRVAGVGHGDGRSDGRSEECGDGRGDGIGIDQGSDARLGQAMHRLLEWGSTGTTSATNTNPNINTSATFSAANIRAVVREFGLSPGQGTDAADIAQRILQGEGAWAWNADLISWQGNEVELRHHNQTLRLDRLVQRRDTGEWWVLDYKSHHTPQNDAALVAQLQNYRDAVRAIYPDSPVQAAFLTGAGTLIRIP